MPDTQQPNFEERLNAIAMHLEIVIGMQQANEKRIAAMGDRFDNMVRSIDNMASHIDTIAGTIDKMADSIGKMAGTIGKMADSINTLGRIAGLHEERFDEHDLSLDKIIERLERLERKH